MFVGDLPNDRLSAALAKAGKHGAGGGAGGAGRHGASALLLAVLVLVAAMVAGVAWEEAVATPLEEGGVGGVAGQSVVTRVLFRLLDPQWLRLPMVGVAYSVCSLFSPLAPA